MSSSADLPLSSDGVDLGDLPAYEVEPGVRPEALWFGRVGRFTPARLTAFTELYGRYGLATAAAVRQWRPQVLDIGFGDGESTLALAAELPGRRVLGVDPFGPGVLALMRALEAGRVEGVRVVRGNVVTLLPEIAPASLERVSVLFPDPWPKRRHAARRLVQTALVAELRDRLSPGGVLHVATDVDAYAAHARTAVSSVAGLVPVAPPARATTKFEARAVAAGRRVVDLAWRRVA